MKIHTPNRQVKLPESKNNFLIRIAAFRFLLDQFISDREVWPTVQLWRHKPALSEYFNMHNMCISLGLQEILEKNSITLQLSISLQPLLWHHFCSESERGRECSATRYHQLGNDSLLSHCHPNNRETSAARFFCFVTAVAMITLRYSVLVSLHSSCIIFTSAIGIYSY